ncbi:MAG: hypothetical protein IJ816_02975 [Alloprevotella sp.]|nr:hypothetical protein [Alloprevotella sp.]
MIGNQIVRLKNFCSIIGYGIALKKISVVSLLINLIILVCTVCNYETLFSQNLWWFFFLVFSGVIWQSYSLVKDIVELLRYPDYNFDQYYIPDEIMLSEETRRKYPQTIINEENGIHAIYNKEVNAFLYDNEAIQLKEDTEKISPLKDYIAQNKDVLFLFLRTRWHSNPRASFYNEDKLCLTSEIDTDALTGGTVWVRRGNYYNSYVTNEIFCKRLLHNDRSMAILPPHNPLVFPLPLLSPLAPFGNHIGASTMALTTDGYLIILFHNNRAIVQPNAYQPTCSGSADYSDWKRLKKRGQTGLADFVREVVLRELKEETTFEADMIQKIELLGMFRDLVRGGKPDFCTLTYLNLSFREALSRFKPDMTEVNNTFEPVRLLKEGKYDVQEFERFIQSHKRSISPVLYMSFIFLRDRFVGVQS